MKNIYEILETLEITVPEEKREEFERELHSNYKTVAETERKDARILQLQEELARKETEYAKDLAEREFAATLSAAISQANGRSHKAIAALLDLQALKTSDDPRAAVDAALEELKKDSGYLFACQTPPLYARGTGAQTGKETRTPATLAGALRERFEQERK